MTERPELTNEWIENAVARARILGIAHQTLRMIPHEIKPQEGNPKFFNISLPFQPAENPFKDGEKPPEEDFRNSVADAIDADGKNLGFRIGTIIISKPAFG